MAAVQIPNLGAAISLNGAEQLEAVQAGVSVRITTDQIAVYAANAHPTNLTFTAPLVLTGAVVSLDTVTVPFGGTGLTSYAIGDLLYASGGTSLAKLADVAVGNVLLSGGVGAAPAYGKVDLTAAVTGILPVTNGGTGQAAALTLNGVVYAASAGAMATSSAGTTGQVLVGNTGSPPTWGAATGVAVTSISFGTTGLTPSSPTQGAVVVAGTLAVTNGGTGLAAAAQGDLLYGSAANTLSRLAKDANATRYLSNTGATNNPAWAQVDLTNGITGLLPFANFADGAAVSVTGRAANTSGVQASIAAAANGNVLRRSGDALAFGQIDLADGTNAVTGTLAATNGGTGNAVYAVGDLLYASTTTVLTRLADVATGSVLKSGGVGVAPAWGTLSGVAGTLTWTNISGATAAVAGTGYVVDTSAGIVTLTLNSAPTVDDYVAVADAAGTFGTNNLTVARNGKPIQGAAADLVLNINGQSCGLVFQGNTNGWRVVAV